MCFLLQIAFIMPLMRFSSVNTTDLLPKRTASLSAIPDRMRSPDAPPLRRAMTETSSSIRSKHGQVQPNSPQSPRHKSPSRALSPKRNIYRQPSTAERTALPTSRPMSDLVQQRQREHIRRHLLFLSDDVSSRRGEVFRDNSITTDIRSRSNKRRQRLSSSSSDNELPDDWPISVDPQHQPPILKTSYVNSSPVRECLGSDSSSSDPGKKAQFSTQVDVMYYDELDKPRSVLRRAKSQGSLKRYCHADILNNETSKSLSAPQELNTQAQCSKAPARLQRSANVDIDNTNSENKENASTCTDDDAILPDLVSPRDVSIRRVTSGAVTSGNHGNLELCLRLRLPTEYILEQTSIKVLSGGRKFTIVAQRKSSNTKTTQDLQISYKIDIYNVSTTIDSDNRVILLRAPIVNTHM